MNKLKNFIDKWNGKFLEAYDASNLNQCYDLITAWANYIGLPAPMTLYAYQIYDTCPDGWIRKQNMSNAKPEAGDIVVWAKGYAGGVAGHTAVATGAGVAEGKDSDWFEVFSQNDPLGTPCKLKKYNFNYVRGWLRPDIDLEVSEPIMSELQKKLDIYFNQVVSPDFVTSFLEERRREIDKLNETVSNKETVISRLQENMIKKDDEIAVLLPKLNSCEVDLSESERLREKWLEQSKTWKENFEDEKNKNTNFQKKITELEKKLKACQVEHDLTWGELINRIWLKIKGVKI